MERPNYQLEENPIYTEEIPKLLNTDPVMAESGAFYNLIFRMLNNTKAAFHHAGNLLLRHNEDNSSHGDLRAELAKKANVEPVEWIYPELLNGAYVRDDVAGQVRYRKAQNIVYVEGWVAGTQLEKAIFVLPMGYRPEYFVSFMTPQSATDDNNNTARIVIINDGYVKVERASSHSLLTEWSVGLCVSFTAHEE